jgi:hypothetical protein
VTAPSAARDAHGRAETTIDPGRLRLMNTAFGVAHLAQAALFIALSEDVRFDVSATFASGPPGEPVTPERLDVLFSYPLGPTVACFSLLSAFFHFLIVSPWGWPRYLRELSRTQNRFRWVEYSLSASLMIVLIAGVTGITDVAALVALFGVNASMILFGWLMEIHNEPGPHVDWSPFVFGCIAGAVPWIAISWYLFGAGSAVPNFVYGIFVSIFVFFNCFAVNQVLQYRRIGRRADYLVGERTYVWLSLTAKSALAWQIYANVLTA